MKRLEPLAVPPSYFDRYESIRTSKHLDVRNRLAAIRTDMIAQYHAYAEAARDSRLQTLLANARCAGLSADLRSCYSGTTNQLRRLKADIEQAQPRRLLQFCPMCATTLPSTFDHYLPTERFPEFSVFALNLVPCCSICNSTKRDDWLDVAGVRQYLHAFTDEIADADFLTVQLYEQADLRGVGAVFRLERPQGIPAGDWNLLASHFSRLRLVERYDKLGNDEIVGILADSRVFIETGGRDARAFVIGQAADRLQAHGRNYWRAVLMQAMALHPNFLTWVAEG